MVRTVFSKYFKGDSVIWAVIIALSVFSLLIVYSSTGTLAYRYQRGDTTHYLFKHAGILLFGLGIIYVTHMIPYRYYSRLAQLFFYIAIPLLILTLVFGISINQASRWLTLPGTGMSFQTSDFAKLALIMFIARMLSKKQDNIKDFKSSFIPLIAPVILTCMLILPANFSTSVILFTTSLIIMFIGRVNIRYILYLMGIGVVFISIFIAVSLLFPSQGRVGTWKNRIESFINGDEEGSYQVDQAKVAIVTGGIIGKGPGHSSQKNLLPNPFSDFIYAIIVEEYGFAGGLLILSLYLILLYRAGVIVRKSPSRFGAFLAIGLTFSLVFQAMINMAVSVNLFPVTGQNLPLVSMGGTSVLFTCVAMGIVLSVSQSISQPDKINETGT